MDSKKLFHVLVVGGSLLGGASGCGDELKEATVLPPQNTTDAGTTPQNDGGTGNDGTGDGDGDTGGGVEGW